MYYRFGNYVSVEQKQKKAEKLVEKLRKQGQQPMPVAAFKGKMAGTFWGKSWCANLENYADYANRLERGRSYARCGCVCHLAVERGKVHALVSGSTLYTLTLRITPLAEERWRVVCAECAGRVGSLLELLQGKISRQVMEIMCDSAAGIFPSPSEISFDCSCPDHASMCKHVAATLYGIGRRLDTEPELLFVLRGVNAGDLIPSGLDFAANAPVDALRDDDLGALFGIDLDTEAKAAPPPPTARQGGAQPPAHDAAPDSATSPAPLMTVSEAPARADRRVKATSEAPAESGGRAKATAKAPAVPGGRVKATAKAPVESDRRVKAAAKAPAESGGPAKTALKAPFKPERPTGAAIRRLRTMAGLTPTAFARALGISTVTLYRWEESRGVLTLRSASVKSLLAFQETLLPGQRS